MYEKAFHIDEAQLGADHPQIATDLVNLAAQLYYEKRHEDAMASYLRAQRI